MVFSIVICGLHGTGKSTYAKKIAHSFRLRHISAGDLFRQLAAEQNKSLTELSQEAEKSEAIDHLLDERTKKEIAQGGTVIDALLAGWMGGESKTLKIYLSAPFKTRISRIASRDGVSYVEAEKVTILREQIERRRFKRLYDIDIDDLSIYDLVINTGLMPIAFNIEVIKTFVEGYITSHGDK